MPAPYNNKTDISLDPRLALYIETKKFNRKNNIKNFISEEEQYGISKYDIMVIKNYLKGEKNNICNNPDMIKTKSTNLIMGFDYKKDDPRYKKIVKKMDENRLAKEKISRIIFFIIKSHN